MTLKTYDRYLIEYLKTIYNTSIVVTLIFSENLMHECSQANRILEPVLGFEQQGIKLTLKSVSIVCIE